MFLGSNVRYSDEWWLDRLESALRARREDDGWQWRNDNSKLKRRPPLELLHRYLHGDPPLPPSVGGWDDVMRGYYKMSRLNLARLAVSTPAAKMQVLGFRTAADDDVDGDQRAARIYQANQLDVALSDAFAWMLTFGDSYLMVGPPRDDDPEAPIITPEHPFEVITSDDPLTGLPRAALKLFRDADLEEDRAYLYMPGYLRVAVRASFTADWKWSDELSFTFPAGMEDVVPIRRLKNFEGVGEFESHLDLLNRINEQIFDRMTIAKYQAYRMRVVTGVPSTRLDDDGNEVPVDYSDVFTNDPGSVTVVGDPGDENYNAANIKFWESSTTDLNGVRQAILDEIKNFAVVTDTPHHLVAPDASQGSAEGAALTRESGTWKVEDRRRRVQHTLAQTMSLAFRFLKDDERTDVTQIRTIWAPAERYSLAERADAAVKAKAADIPWAARAQDIWQYSPSEIAWMETQRADDALLATPTPAERTAASSAAGLSGNTTTQAGQQAAGSIVSTAGATPTVNTGG